MLGGVRKQVGPPRDGNNQLLERGDHNFFPVLDFELAMVGSASRRLDEHVPELQERQTDREGRDGTRLDIWSFYMRTPTPDLVWGLSKFSIPKPSFYHTVWLG